jgi:hypothetical protein
MACCHQTGEINWNSRKFTTWQLTVTARSDEWAVAAKLPVHHERSRMAQITVSTTDLVKLSRLIDAMAEYDVPPRKYDLHIASALIMVMLGDHVDELYLPEPPLADHL